MEQEELGPGDEDLGELTGIDTPTDLTASAPQGGTIGGNPSVISETDRHTLGELAVATMRRALNRRGPPRNAGVQVSAATAILDRVWPKPTAHSAAIQVNLNVNGGPAAIETWEARASAAREEG